LTAAVFGAAASLATRTARAQDASATDPTKSGGPVSVAPPPLETPYLEYGAAFTAELVTSAGKMCASTSQPCILGSGGGIVARLGRRSAGPWYFGGAYEMSKQDPSSLYRFATLQQLRAEVRWYLTTGLDTYPYAAFGGGAAAYGNEWGIDTYGPSVFIGLGMETQISRQTVVGLAAAYRLIGLRSFRDSTGFEREGSVVQVFGFDFVVEERNPIAQSSHGSAR
jgi:hypothetical protein